MSNVKIALNQKQMESALLGAAKNIKSNIFEEIAVDISNAYKEQKRTIENVVLRSENKEEDQQKRIPTNLKIKKIKNKDAIDVSIVPESGDPVDALVIKSQDTGIGIKVDDRILEKFDVQDEKTEDTNLNKYYFEPTHFSEKFKENLIKKINED